MHAPCDYEMCSFPTRALMRGRLEVERLHAQKTGTETLHLQRVNKLLLRDSAPLLDQSVDQLNELAF